MNKEESFIIEHKDDYFSFTQNKDKATRFVNKEDWDFLTESIGDVYDLESIEIK